MQPACSLFIVKVELLQMCLLAFEVWYDYMKKMTELCSSLLGIHLGLDPHLQPLEEGLYKQQGLPGLSPTFLYTGACRLPDSHHRVQLMPRRIPPRKLTRQPLPAVSRVDTPLKGSPCCHHMLQHRSRMRMFFLLLFLLLSLCKTHSESLQFRRAWRNTFTEDFLTFVYREGARPTSVCQPCSQSVMLCC